MSASASNIFEPNALFLVAVSGPRIEPLQLSVGKARGKTLTIGRHESCDLTLPTHAESVSRFHARFRFDAAHAQWRVFDLSSSWGTYLNGIKLTPHHELPLAENDLLRLEPWTFLISKRSDRHAIESEDDSGKSMVRTISDSGPHAQGVREDLFSLMLDAAGAIHRASTEMELVERLLAAAVRGSGLPNAAVIRAVNSGGQFEVIASTAGGQAAPFSFSRSLLKEASKGRVAELAGEADPSQSIVQLHIAAALCVPLMIGPSPAAYLYLDARLPSHSRHLQRPPVPDAAKFCTALGTLGGFALANLKRLDIERRQAAMEHDLTAAAVAQKWLLPQRHIKVPPFMVTGESRPGRHVGGDFFDVIQLADGRIAIALGDVSGKGVDASVLMTATHGFLHAALLYHNDLALAVAAVNAFVSPRRPTNRFVTLWVGLLDSVAKTITYVDAGHGFAVLVEGDGKLALLNQAGGPPLGVMDDYVYGAAAIPLPEKGRVVVVSDGIIEQPAMEMGQANFRFRFELPGVHEALNADTGDDVGELFKRLTHHAGSTQLADDATAVCVQW